GRAGMIRGRRAGLLGHRLVVGAGSLLLFGLLPRGVGGLVGAAFGALFRLAGLCFPLAFSLGRLFLLGVLALGRGVDVAGLRLVADRLLRRQEAELDAAVLLLSLLGVV